MRKWSFLYGKVVRRDDDETGRSQQNQKIHGQPWQKKPAEDKKVERLSLQIRDQKRFPAAVQVAIPVNHNVRGRIPCALFIPAVPGWTLTGYTGQTASM
jgi:hypothetical protein